MSARGYFTPRGWDQRPDLEPGKIVALRAYGAVAEATRKPLTDREIVAGYLTHLADTHTDARVRTAASVVLGAVTAEGD